MKIIQCQRNLENLVNSLYIEVKGKYRVDDTRIIYWRNHEIFPPCPFIDNGSKTASFIDYAAHHKTIETLHNEIEPIGASLVIYNNYSGGEAALRISNLTLLKSIVATNIRSMISNSFEYEIFIWNNERAYSADLSTVFEKAIEGLP